MDTNRINKFPSIQFGEFLSFVRIWLLVTSNLSMEQGQYSSYIPIQPFGRCLICVNQIISANLFEGIRSDVKFITNHPLLHFGINCLNTDR